MLLLVWVLRLRPGVPSWRASTGALPFGGLRDLLGGMLAGLLPVALWLPFGARAGLPPTPTLTPVPPQLRWSFAVSAAAPPTPPSSRHCMSQECP